MRAGVGMPWARVAGGEALPGHDVVACPAGARYEDIAARLGA